MLYYVMAKKPSTCLFCVFYELQKDFVKVMLAINSFLYEILEIHSHAQGGFIMSRIQGDR